MFRPSPPRLGNILSSLSPSRKRELTPCAERLRQGYLDAFAEKKLGRDPVEWYASLEGYARLLGGEYSIWQISRAKTELEHAAYITRQQRKDPATGKWTSTLVRPGARMWSAIARTIKEWRHRLRKTANKAPPLVEIEGKKLQKAPPGGASFGEQLTKTVWDRLTRASLRHPPPEPPG